MADAIYGVLLVLSFPATTYLVARAVGLGRCDKCGRACAPWGAYCWRHAPDLRAGGGDG